MTSHSQPPHQPGKELPEILTTNGSGKVFHEPLLPAALRIAVLQWDVRRGDPAANLEALDRLLDQVTARAPHLVVLPEMWTRSFCGSELRVEADLLEERREECRRRARIHRVWLAAGTLPEPSGESRVYNTLRLFDPEGNERMAYRKIHLFPNTNEPKFFLPGDRVPDVLDLGPWKIGVGICFDLRFPELFRMQAKAGANLFLLPAQFPKPRRDLFVTLSRARAIENLAVFIAVNRTGTEGGLSFFGNSLVADPNGDLRASCDEGEGFAIAEVHADEVGAYRRDFPFLAHTPLLPAGGSRGVPTPPRGDPS